MTVQEGEQMIVSETSPIGWPVDDDPRTVGQPADAQLLMLMAQGSSTPLVVVDLSGRVVGANPTCAELVPEPGGVAIGQPAWPAAPISDRPRTARRRVSPPSRHGPPPPTEQVCFDGIGNRRRILWSYVPVPGNGALPGYLIGTGVDVTRDSFTKAGPSQPSDIDSLTGLANRVAFEESIAEHADSDSGLGCGVLLCDLDGIHALTDAVGQAAVEELLIEVGQRLTTAVRVDDLVARLDCDQFAVVLPAAGLLEMRALTFRLEGSIRRPVRLPSGPITVAVNIALAVIEPGDDAAHALHDAKIAMSAAKTKRAARARSRSSAKG